jgi:hypothetical protein
MWAFALAEFAPLLLLCTAHGTSNIYYTGAGLAPLTSVPGPGSHHPHLHWDLARPTHMFTRSGLTPPHICAGTGRAIAVSSPEVGSPVQLRCRGGPRQRSRAPREYPSTSNASAPACGYPVREYPVSTLANLSASPTPSARPRAGAYAPPRPRAAARSIYICICICICICIYIYICIAINISLSLQIYLYL